MTKEWEIALDAIALLIAFDGSRRGFIIESRGNQLSRQSSPRE